MRDQRLGIDRMLGNYEAGNATELLPLGVDTREYDRLPPLVGSGGAQAVEDRREDVVVEAVVERDLRRGAHDDDRASAIERELFEHR